MDFNLSFLKKLSVPKFSLGMFTGKPTEVAGVDIGSFSTKVIQLKYEKEKAVLETYGELLNSSYLKEGEISINKGFLRFSDNDIAVLLKDVLKESNVTAKNVIFSVPATSSFITNIQLPRISKSELGQTIQYEARKYIPIPISEVILDWDLIEDEEDTEDTDETKNITNVLLVAVPREIVEKFKRIAGLANINLLALEVESFSMLRALNTRDPFPTAFVNIGHQSTVLAIADKGRIRVSHSFNRGSGELTRVLQRGMGVNPERAEAIKREIGLSEKIEEREITSIISPLIETLFDETERLISIYNRKSKKTVQKVNLTGGGSHLKGLVERAASKFGVEVTRGNPFARIVTPAFMQPVLRDIGPNFSVATGLALREITT